MLEPDILLTLKLHQQLFIDPRRIDLLKQIAVTGSLSQAAKAIGISYKTAWDAVNEMNSVSPKPMVVSTTGGKGGGGAVLSSYATRFLLLYDLLTKLQYNAFKALSDDDVPLDNLLAATARLSLQTSARNQLYATIKQLNPDVVAGLVTVELDDKQTQLDVNITQQSIQRLHLAENKSIILLIKAPNVNISLSSTHHEPNQFIAEIKLINEDDIWSEIELSLNSGLVICATKLTKEVQLLGLVVGQSVSIQIHPENIIIAALV